MTRNRRTRILVRDASGLRTRLADEVRASCDARLIEEPSWGLVMLTVRETARGSLFHPGEVLVSQAKAMVDGAIGLGLALGDAPDTAAELALIDGAFNAASPAAASWEALLLAAEEEELATLERENADVMRTKVDFGTMDEEVRG